MGPKRGPKMGPKPHGNIGAPDGRQCDFGHISCSGRPQNGVQNTPFWTPFWGPNRGSNWRVQTAVNVILGVWASREGLKIGVPEPLFWTPFWGPNRGSNLRVQTAVNVILAISAVRGRPKIGVQNRGFWTPFLRPPGPVDMGKITLTAVWTLNVSMGFGPHFWTPFWGSGPWF